MPSYNDLTSFRDWISTPFSRVMSVGPLVMNRWETVRNFRFVRSERHALLGPSRPIRYPTGHVSCPGSTASEPLFVYMKRLHGSAGLLRVRGRLLRRAAVARIRRPRACGAVSELNPV